ncbi:Asp/Glu racemase [Paracidovorax citrulli AAC00-1]|uniref:Asp/Glu racemase n=1 Tax=Paracidovorax citrulli (strain AAC00-1) TaxID=397945 RepID=A1TMF7_PARC0|nr:Asp/Glu racemase [Paracidovorax citrulli AAC00-1]
MPPREAAAQLRRRGPRQDRTASGQALAGRRGARRPAHPRAAGARAPGRRAGGHAHAHAAARRLHRPPHGGRGPRGVRGPPPHRVAPDAVLIGCFGDPGLFALRECSPVPVTGLAEASFLAVARHGRFGIVTDGERWEAMLLRLAQALGHADRLAGVRTVAPSGAELAADPAGAQALLARACQAMAREPGVQAVVLGGAGLAGMAKAVQPRVDVPVIDSVEAGAGWALQAPPPAGREAPGCDVAWENVPEALRRMGTGRLGKVCTTRA